MLKSPAVWVFMGLLLLLGLIVMYGTCANVMNYAHRHNYSDTYFFGKQLTKCIYCHRGFSAFLLYAVQMVLC